MEVGKYWTKLEELIEKTKQTGLEHGLVICEDGQVKTKIGEQASITLPSCAKKIICGFHTHPKGGLEPSINDMNASLDRKCDCIGGLSIYSLITNGEEKRGEYKVACWEKRKEASPAAFEWLKKNIAEARIMENTLHKLLATQDLQSIAKKYSKKYEEYAAKWKKINEVYEKVFKPKAPITDWMGKYSSREVKMKEKKDET